MTRMQKPTYDVVTPLDVDYLDAFGAHVLPKVR